MNAIPSKIHVLESILSNAIEKIYLSFIVVKKKKKVNLEDFRNSNYIC